LHPHKLIKAKEHINGGKAFLKNFSIFSKIHLSNNSPHWSRYYPSIATHMIFLLAKLDSLPVAELEPFGQLVVYFKIIFLREKRNGFTKG
jgi:hypothetical protein